MPRTGEVPANLRGIFWWPVSGRAADAGVTPPSDEVVLLRRHGEDWRLAPFDIVAAAHGGASEGRLYVLEPRGGFAPGARYQARARGTCRAPNPIGTPPDGGAPDGGIYPGGPLDGGAFGAQDASTPNLIASEIAIGKSRTLPARLGTLHVRPTRRQILTVEGGAGCSYQTVAVAAEVELELDAEARPWQRAFAYTTFVDGEPYTPSRSLGVEPPKGASWIGRGKDLVYIRCPLRGDEQELVPPWQLGGPPEETRRTVEVAMHAALPNLEEPLRTETISVELDCDAHPPLTAPDASVPDTRSSDPDAAVAPPVDGSDAAAADASMNGSEAGGCDGCSLSGSGHTGALGPWLVVLAVLARRRRRLR